MTAVSQLERPRGLLVTVGAPLVAAGRDLGSLWRLFAQTLWFAVRGKRERGAVLAQMFELGNRSLFFVSMSMAFLGAILVFESGMQAAKILPDYTVLGAFYVKLLVRDLAASIGAMPLATRIGAGIASELGTMVVTDQVDALRMCGAEPVEHLVVPRFLASIVTTFAVLIVAGGVALFAGMLTAYVAFDVNPRTFLDLGLLTAGDVVVGLSKCLVYGAAIPIVASHRGLAARGGAEGVGRATTDAVVHSTFAIILLDFALSVGGFLMFPS